MKNNQFFLIVLLSLYVSTMVAQKTITLQFDATKGKDAFIDQLKPTNNYANSDLLISYSWTFNAVAGLGNSLVQFDISDIPANSTIVEAKLSLYHNPGTSSAGQAGTNASYLKKVTSAWTENTVTWNTAPTTSATGQILLATSTTATQDYLDIDVTEFVKEWYATPVSNNGLMLELIDKALYNSMKFCSSDYTDAAKRPKLVIIYNEPVESCITYQPNAAIGKDAFVDNLNATKNFGNSANLISYSWTFGGTPGLGNSLFQFDIASIPVNSSVTSAKLSLYHNPDAGSAGQAGVNASYLKKITSAWEENTVTWNTVPTTNTTGQILLPTSITNNQDYLDIDIADFVKEWYANPASNNGLMLELNDKSVYNSMKFCSSDYVDSVKRPKLVVCYKLLSDVKTLKNVDFNAYIYPNPVKSEMTVGFNTDVRKFTLMVYSTNGMELFRKTIYNSKAPIDMSRLKKGIYMVRIITEKKTETIKINKE